MPRAFLVHHRRTYVLIFSDDARTAVDAALPGHSHVIRPRDSPPSVPRPRTQFSSSCFFQIAGSPSGSRSKKREEKKVFEGSASAADTAPNHKSHAPRIYRRWRDPRPSRRMRRNENWRSISYASTEAFVVENYPAFSRQSPSFDVRNR